MTHLKERIIFIGIVLFGLILRVLFLDKPSGFWHNEMVMYNQAIAGFPFGIIKASVQADVHFPLYQLLLAVWMKIFSNSDVVVRAFSVLMGTLTIVFAFFTGKEYKDEKLGNIFAFLVAINSVFIFYSQEVKFYIMLALLGMISLYCLVRIKNKNDVLSHIVYAVSNIAIIYTFTIGIFYVLAQGLAFLAYILVKDRQLLKKFIFSNLAIALSMLPFALYVLLNLGRYESASWIFTSNFYTTFVLIQNYFSPALIAVYNNPVVYVPQLAFMSFIFVYIPVLLAFVGMFRALKENKNNLFILLIPVIFLICEIILCYNSGLRMLTRYTILAIVPFLFLVAVGFRLFKPWVLRLVITYLLIINVFYLLASPQSAVRGYRDLGQKPMAVLMTQNKIKDTDIMILALRKNDFDKYLKFNGKKYSMLQDFVYKDYAFNPSLKDKYDAFKEYVFDEGFVNNGFEKYFVKNIIEKMKKGDRIFLIWDENYEMYPFKDVSKYRSSPVMTLSISKTNADTFRVCNAYLKLKSGFQIRHYKLFIFEK